MPTMFARTLQAVVIFSQVASLVLVDAFRHPVGRSVNVLENHPNSLHATHEHTPVHIQKPFAGAWVTNLGHGSKGKLVLPKPGKYEPDMSGQQLVLASTFDFREAEGCAQSPSGLLGHAFSRYSQLLKATAKGAPSNYARKLMQQKESLERSPSEREGEGIVLHGLDVLIKTDKEVLELGMDESYQLDVRMPRVLITANTIWGAIRALETFSQLVSRDSKQGDLVVDVATIHDAPRFAHRGVMIDTSRHYLTLPTILEVLDAMAYSKLNVLHWHMVDDQSFPFESVALPKLVMGAFNTDHVYTHSDVVKVVEHARRLGIRVIPEFDQPGHTESWGVGYPELLSKCPTKVSDRGPFDPTVNTTMILMKMLLRELSELFPDKNLHIGGDEVDETCWMGDPDVLARMRSMNIRDPKMLQSFYEQQLTSATADVGKTPIVWEEVFANMDKMYSIHPSTWIQVWMGGLDNWKDTMDRITKEGYHALLSAPWYLNVISYGNGWREYYRVDPHDFPGTKEQKQLVHGGEACMWGEFVDSANIIPFLWARVAAVAERLWSPQETRNEDEAEDRLNAFRCHLIARDINAEPITIGSFCDKEYQSSYHSPQK